MNGLNQRGIAMPMALLCLVILTSLMVAFVLLAQSEPDIANNHMMSARAPSPKPAWNARCGP